MARVKVNFFFLSPAAPGAAVAVREVSKGEWDVGAGGERDGLEVSVIAMPDRSFRLQTDTWYQRGSFAELTVNAVDLPGTLRLLGAERSGRPGAVAAS